MVRCDHATAATTTTTTRKIPRPTALAFARSCPSLCAGRPDTSTASNLSNRSLASPIAAAATSFRFLDATELSPAYARESLKNNTSGDAIKEQSHRAKKPYDQRSEEVRCARYFGDSGLNSPRNVPFCPNPTLAAHNPDVAAGRLWNYVDFPHTVLFSDINQWARRHSAKFKVGGFRTSVQSHAKSRIVSRRSEKHGNLF